MALGGGSYSPAAPRLPGARWWRGCSSRQWEAVIAVMWGYGAGWGWGAWLAMGVSMVVLWELVIAGGIVLVRSLAGGRNQHPSATRDALGEAERILADRFARGEIDEDEYRRRTEVLHSGR